MTSAQMGSGDRRRTTRPHAVALILMALPLLVFWVYSTWISYDYPYQAQDPEYTYFLSSLAPFKGGGYVYADHPGTPLSTVGTVILAVMYPFLGQERASFIFENLANPALFLTLCHALLLALSVGCAFFFYFTALEGRLLAPDRRLAAALALLFYTLDPASFTTLAYWSHNSFNYPLGTFFLLLLYRAVRSNAAIRLRTLCLLGLAAGLLTAIMIYFLVWLTCAALTIAIYYRLRAFSARKTVPALLVFGIASAVGFGISVLPALPSMPAFFEFVGRNVAHQGPYGRGELGFPSPYNLLIGFGFLSYLDPVLLLVGAGTIALSVIYLVRWHHRSSEVAGLWALLLGLTVQILGAVVLVSKQPQPLYLLQIAATLPVMLLTVLQLRERTPQFGLHLGNLITMGGLGGLIAALIVSMAVQRDRIANIAASQEAVARLISPAGQLAAGPRRAASVVWGYFTLSPCGGLLQYLPYVQLFADEDARLCPGQYAWVDWVQPARVAFSSDGTAATLDQIPWDYVIVPRIFLTIIPPAHSSSVTVDSLNGSKTSWPGYAPDLELVVIKRGAPK